jgi:hypothetical protein
VSFNTSIPGWKTVRVHKPGIRAKFGRFSSTLTAIGELKSSHSICTSQHILGSQIFRTMVSSAEFMSSPRPGFGPRAVQVEAFGRRRGGGKKSVYIW